MQINYPIQYQSSIKYAVCIFFDRIDIQCKITPVPFKDISKVEPGEPIADLDGAERVEVQHISEAIGYRNLDRGDWAERGL